MIVVGDRVRVARTREVGIVRSFVEPRPGWRRALVAWTEDQTEQYVDAAKLERVEDSEQQEMPW